MKRNVDLHNRVFQHLLSVGALLRLLASKVGQRLGIAVRLQIHQRRGTQTRGSAGLQIAQRVGKGRLGQEQAVGQTLAGLAETAEAHV